MYEVVKSAFYFSIGFQEHILLKDLIVFFSFLATLNKSLSKFRQTFSGRVAGTAFYSSRRKMWEKTFFLKKLKVYFFGLWVKNFLSFIKIFSAAFWMLHSECPRELFWETYVLKNFISLLYTWNFEQNFAEIEAKTFRQVCQNCILRLQRNFLKKYVNCENLWVYKFLRASSDIVLDFQQKCFGRAVNSAFYASSGTLWGRKLYL